jgi:hypothetical protein
MNDREIEEALRGMIADLERMVSEDDKYSGILDYFRSLALQFRTGDIKLPLGAPRAMDWHGGFSIEMIDRAAKITNAIQQRQSQ